MVKIYNPDLFKEIQRKFNLKGEEISETYDGIMPCVNIKPRINVVASATLADSGATSASIYSVPSDKDFYVTSVSLSYSKDVNATTTYFAIYANVDGSTKYLAWIATVAGVAEHDSLTLAFPYPIRIDKAGTIGVVVSANVASFRMAGGITGYYEDTLSSNG